MKYYEKMLKLGCFSFDEAKGLIGTEQTTLTVLNEYVKKGYIVKIRRGLYVAINLYDYEPVSNRFEIGAKLSKTAVISHHSAFEFYGLSNQVSYNVSVTSDSRFNPFNFNGYSYERFMPTISKGVDKIGSVYVTDIERTILDSINDFEKNMGFEELIKCISLVSNFDENKLVNYLDEYNKCYLYQKVGFVFEHLKDELSFSDELIKYCLYKSGKSSRYLMKDYFKKEFEFSSKWHLTYPKNLWIDLEGGKDFANI